MNNLAILLQQQGQLEKAKGMFERTLQGYKNALGDSHPVTLRAMNNLANLLKAEGLYERTVEGREKALGDSYPDTLSTVNKVAKEEVQRLYERATKCWSKKHLIVFSHLRFVMVMMLLMSCQ